jgi:hypothetical protein
LNTSAKNADRLRSPRAKGLFDAQIHRIDRRQPPRPARLDPDVSGLTSPSGECRPAAPRHAAVILVDRADVDASPPRHAERAQELHLMRKVERQAAIGVDLPVGIDVGARITAFEQLRVAARDVVDVALRARKRV